MVAAAWQRRWQYGGGREVAVAECRQAAIWWVGVARIQPLCTHSSWLPLSHSAHTYTQPVATTTAHRVYHGHSCEHTQLNTETHCCTHSTTAADVQTQADTHILCRTHPATHTDTAAHTQWCTYPLQQPLRWTQAATHTQPPPCKHSARATSTNSISFCIQPATHSHCRI